MQKVLQLASVCCPCCAAKSSDNEVDVGSNFEYVVHNHYIYKVRKPATTVRTGIPEEFKIGDTISNHSSPTYRRDKKKSGKSKCQVCPEYPDIFETERVIPDRPVKPTHYKVYNVLRKDSISFAETQDSMGQEEEEQIEEEEVLENVRGPSLEQVTVSREDLQRSRFTVTSSRSSCNDETLASAISEQIFASNSASEHSADSLKRILDMGSQPVKTNKRRNFKDAMNLSEPIDDKKTLVWHIYLTDKVKKK
ncbi:uncharacterized protein LOC106672710 isoform X1 [Cimex lectularius]|uniref:Uncharacterized protein n=1 Tax=Cimex lectularius TaxID=79782 RepID=A0A8I6SA59_CIMLE|nr:uncharacterized protein LOC106672710 isoform X1 [Cimex lectularius]